MMGGDNRIGYWGERVADRWHKTVEGILDTGRILIDARTEMQKIGVPFSDLIGDRDGKPSRLKFNFTVAYRLIAIAGDDKILSHCEALPPSWETLFALTRLSENKFYELLEAGVINPGMQRKDLKAAEKAEKIERRTVRERELGEQQRGLPGKRYGVILADPEWRFEPYSRDTGMDRAADNHYSTSPTEIIAARNVASIAAFDAVLFLWATMPMLPQALQVMDAWNFAYKSHCVWTKDREGTGYWFRCQHEVLLVGVKGNPPAPAPGQQYLSAINAPVGEHSQKPAIFQEMIESYFPTLAKIELNCRGTPRRGWDGWGFEVAQAAK